MILGLFVKTQTCINKLRYLFSGHHGCCFWLSSVSMHYSFSLSYYVWLLNASDPPSTEGKVWICRRLRDELRFFLDLRESCIRIESFLVWRRSYLCASLYYIQPPSLQRPTRTLCNLLNTCGKLKVSVILDKVEYMDSCALSHDPAHSPCNKKAEETSTSKLMSGFQIKKWELYGKGAFCL